MTDLTKLAALLLLLVGVLWIARAQIRDTRSFRASRCKATELGTGRVCLLSSDHPAPPADWHVIVPDSRMTREGHVWVDSW